MNTTKALAIMLLGALAAPVWANGPAYDASGNGNLNGTYYFRQVAYGTDQSGDITEGIALNGSLIFYADGTFAMPIGANEYDYEGQGLNGGPSTSVFSGTYTLSASGLGYMSSPLNYFTGNSDTIYFTLGTGGR
jgi:hypothetical protein